MASMLESRKTVTIILSVAHNLIYQNTFLHSISDDIFQSELLPTLTNDDKNFVTQSYIINQSLRKWYWNKNQNNFQKLLNISQNHQTDFRYPNIYSKNICSPYLIIQFKKGNFYGTEKFNLFFEKGLSFFEQNLDRHTYLIKLNLIKIFKDFDIALYKIENNEKKLLDLIPSIKLDFQLHTNNNKDIYCLQGAPINELGRLFNRATIDGILDHFSPQLNIRGENIIFQGLRYLIKGYFRFGSSGAPYLIYNKWTNSFSVNAIQSEACPLQLLIQGNRDSNAQYVNAIASPMYNIKDEILELINKSHSA